MEASWYRDISFVVVQSIEGKMNGVMCREVSVAIHRDDEDETWVDPPAGQRSKQTAKETVSCLQKKKIKVVELPIESPDLNPMWKGTKIVKKDISFSVQGASSSCHCKQMLLHRVLNTFQLAV